MLRHAKVQGNRRRAALLLIVKAVRKIHSQSRSFVPGWAQSYRSFRAFHTFNRHPASAQARTLRMAPIQRRLLRKDARLTPRRLSQTRSLKPPLQSCLQRSLPEGRESRDLSPPLVHAAPSARRGELATGLFRSRSWLCLTSPRHEALQARHRLADLSLAMRRSSSRAA